MALVADRAVPRRLRACAGVVVLATIACNPPPLAPSGATLFLTAASSSVSSTGSVDIIAVLMEQGGATTATPGTTTGRPAGTPVQDGTLVSFLTNLGRIEPVEARTENGSVKVRFTADGRSGTATVLAYSGTVRGEIALKVGTAAVDSLTLLATPLGPTGGSSTVTATAHDAGGTTLPDLTIQFTTTRGTLSASSARTNAAGEASVTLSTTVEAIVTATVGTKTATVTVTPR
jgi:hypothetical protein